jgi:hypothetical protein
MTRTISAGNVIESFSAFFESMRFFSPYNTGSIKYYFMLRNTSRVLTAAQRIRAEALKALKPPEVQSEGGRDSSGRSDTCIHLAPDSIACDASTICSGLSSAAIDLPTTNYSSKSR